jgi:hypothetical protein
MASPTHTDAQSRTPDQICLEPGFTNKQSFDFLIHNKEMNEKFETY